MLDGQATLIFFQGKNKDGSKINVDNKPDLKI